MNKVISSIAGKWQQELAAGGYENEVCNSRDFTRLTKLSRTWRYILTAANLKPGASVFEFGCGGGNQLVPLAVRGYKCSGIDCSEEVLVRCRQFISDVEKFAGEALDIQLVQGDFLSFVSGDTYDLVFNFGVIEHFIDNCEREMAVQTMFHLCKPGGYVVSVVPNGMHPLRERMKREGLGGYQIPEIDYSPQSMAAEMMQAGARQVEVIPYNLFGYMTIAHAPYFLKLMKRLYYYIWQVVPLRLLPSRFVSRHAYGLIGIAKKLA